MTTKQKIWIITVQTGVSLGMLAWLFYIIIRDDQLNQIFEGWNSTSPYWLVGGFLFTLLSFIFATIRWHQIGVVLDINEPGRKMFSHFMAGQFVSNFLPTTVGGDVIRVTRLSMDTGKTRNSFATVVLDRFCGWPILGIISLIGFGINRGLISKGGGTATTAIVVSAVTILIFLLISYLATHENMGNRIKNSTGLLKYFSAIHTGLAALKNDILHTIEVIITTFAMQFSALFAAGCLAEALNINEIGMLFLMAYLPPILIIQVLPISIGGFGIRETILTIALSTIGVEEVQAVQLGLSLGFMNLVTSLIGAPALAFGGTKSPNNKNKPL